MSKNKTPIIAKRAKDGEFYTQHAKYDYTNGTDTRNADAFAYNVRSEVTSAILHSPFSILHSYGYDGIGNSTNFIANCLNQYTLCGSVPLCEFTYDLDGNLLSNGGFSYAYDAANRLSSVSSNDVVLASFAYDAKGRRVRKVTPTATRRYFYDGWLLVRETATDLSTLQPFNSSTDYVWGKDLSGTLQGAGGVGGLLYLTVSNSNSNSNSQLQLYIPFYDNNGNITRYCDAQGNVVASYTYDAFGNTIAQSGPMADDFALRFSTKYFDGEANLYYYGCRYYHPPLMRWLNCDPIGEEGGVNLYAFCGNNGINRIDSLGEDWHVMRCHLPFAEAKRDNVHNDTIYKLSQEIDLDPMEALQWARKEMSGSKFVSKKELNRACRVYIPNRISLVLPVVPEITYGQAFIPIMGQYKASRTLNMISMRNRLREISEMYYNRGFSIESLDYWIENDSISIMYKDGNSRKWPTFGFIIGGHGWAGSISVTHSTGDDYESIGISKAKRGYALGMLYVFGCYAGSGNWWGQAAPSAYRFVSPAWRPTIRLEMPTPRFPSK